MKKHLVSEIRKLSQVKGKMRPWIADLTDEQLYEIFLKLRNGEPAKAIARSVKQSWGVLPQSSIHSISQGLLKFRRRISHLLLSPPVIGIPDEIEPKDALENMEEISQLQQERIMAMLREEKELGVRFANIARDIKALTTLRKAIIKEKDFMMMHQGFNPTSQRKLERRKETIDTRFKSLMATGDVGNNFIEAADLLLERFEKETLTLQTDEYGKHKLVKSDENLT